MTLILGSQSPRRKEILNFFSIPFKQVTPEFDEESVQFNGDPKAYASLISDGKSDWLAKHYPNEVILTADTIVYQDGKVYGKPSNEKESFGHLKALVGNWHSVFTSLTLRTPSQKYQIVEETKVLFNQLNDEQIKVYHLMLPCADKAGGYMIQGAGSMIVKKIEGCYYNVMGLPLNGLSKVLSYAGIDLWQHLKGN